MQSIAVFNNKGGVGKTTLLTNLAACLALNREKKILVVDADPQCNATQSMFQDKDLERFYLTKSDANSSIFDLLKPIQMGRGYSSSLKFHESKSFGVDVIIGDPRLSLFEDFLAKDWSEAISGQPRGMQTSLIFRHFLSLCEEYDLVFFDMGPSLGSINRSVLIACDFFLTPMSIDIFSVAAIENISTALVQWKKDLEVGAERLEDQDISLEIPQDWKLRFSGYVTQQYTAKRDAEGRRRPVKAFDRILKSVPKQIQKSLVKKFQSDYENINYALGTIPTLHSLVPLSQTNRRPIFDLRASDGVVGAHFSKVREYKSIIMSISDRLIENLDELS